VLGKGKQGHDRAWGHQGNCQALRADLLHAEQAHERWRDEQAADQLDLPISALAGSDVHLALSVAAMPLPHQSFDAEAHAYHFARAIAAKLAIADDLARPAYSIDERALTHARLMDGKLLLVTNTVDLTPEGVVKRYKSLADIERGFRVLKSEIEIGPIYHRLPDRIRAHAAICFMALILYRVMRTRLHASDTALSPERALTKLRRIQHHRVTLNGTESVAGISTINREQTDILTALTIKKPTLDTQLTLL